MMTAKNSIAMRYQRFVFSFFEYSFVSQWKKTRVIEIKIGDCAYVLSNGVSQYRIE